ncbi:MAG: EscE/YscE/SsaE family type III secretion system needle protein co-chaperone [Desulfosporosinus sp.]|nr:EscE/YscE/SsaE family type III secretion system needle protein co-chaperone [Desulfosporosinus sp.]
MDTKNAKQHVADVTNHLSNARKCLNNALRNSEKPPENKQQIQDTLNAVEKALQSATATLTNYKG